VLLLASLCHCASSDVEREKECVRERKREKKKRKQSQVERSVRFSEKGTNSQERLKQTLVQILLVVENIQKEKTVED